ncbi:hypothetical protein MW887_008878 [Aspergillus wentii]|nr:hypothetical protein MW887_008878 [Aspergillus wentii]
MSMDAQIDEATCPHFALIYIDLDGKLRFEASPSVANSYQTILSPNVTETFMRAVAISDKGDPPTLPGLESASQTNKLPGLRDASLLGQESSTLRPIVPEAETQNKEWLTDKDRRFQWHADGYQIKKKKISHDSVVPMSINCSQRTMLPVRNEKLLRQYYEKAFESLQQINCRILAKAYIKLVEPRKQVNFPYNGRKIISGTSHQLDPETTKPAWWPSGVTHREPDHLLKAERVRLLVHILCELRNSHAVSVGKLKEADQSIRRQISPPERLQVLDEIYQVRQEEELYLDGRVDEQTKVCVSRVHLPDHMKAQALESDSRSYGVSARKSGEMNPVYRNEVPDLEAHTSVFPSTGTSPTSNTSSPYEVPQNNVSEHGTFKQSTQQNWATSLPPLTSSSGDTKRSRENDNTYQFSFSFPQHHTAPVPVDSQPFPMKYYSEPHYSQPQTVPNMGLPGASLGTSAHPYYYAY